MVGPQKKRGLRALRHGWATQKKGLRVLRHGWATHHKGPEDGEWRERRSKKQFKKKTPPHDPFTEVCCWQWRVCWWSWYWSCRQLDHLDGDNYFNLWWPPLDWQKKGIGSAVVSFYEWRTTKVPTYLSLSIQWDIRFSNGAFTLNVKLVFNENLGGILGGTQC